MSIRVRKMKNGKWKWKMGYQSLSSPYHYVQELHSSTAIDNNLWSDGEKYLAQSYNKMSIVGQLRQKKNWVKETVPFELSCSSSFSSPFLRRKQLGLCVFFLIHIRLWLRQFWILVFYQWRRSRGLFIAFWSYNFAHQLTTIFFSFFVTTIRFCVVACSFRCQTTQSIG